MIHMLRAVGKFILTVESWTFILITLIHLLRLPYNSWDIVLAGYIEVLAKNHVGSLQGTLNIISLWISSISIRELPLKETIIYFWEYKITWVGLAVLIYEVKIRDFLR